MDAKELLLFIIFSTKLKINLYYEGDILFLEFVKNKSDIKLSNLAEFTKVRTTKMSGFTTR